LLPEAPDDLQPRVGIGLGIDGAIAAHGHLDDGVVAEGRQLGRLPHHALLVEGRELERDRVRAEQRAELAHDVLGAAPGVRASLLEERRIGRQTVDDARAQQRLDVGARRRVREEARRER